MYWNDYEMLLKADGMPTSKEEYEAWIKAGHTVAGYGTMSKDDLGITW